MPVYFFNLASTLIPAQTFQEEKSFNFQIQFTCETIYLKKFIKRLKIT